MYLLLFLAIRIIKITMFDTAVLTDDVNTIQVLYLQPKGGNKYGYQWHVSYNRVHDKADASFTMQQAEILYFTGGDEFVDRSS